MKQAAEPKPLVLPKRLQPGDMIGIVAPSGPLRGGALEAGIARIEALGYRVLLGDHVHDRHGYLAGEDQARAADFTAMFSNPEVAAVFCVRGGYGAARMADQVDWRVVAANPKIFAGYSDITTLHLAFARKTRQPTLYGPMLTTLGRGISKEAERCFWRLSEQAEGDYLFPAEPERLETLVAGVASGELTGGCLSLLAASVGTPEHPEFAGKLVLIEDVGEAVYRIDRYLVQLLRSTDLRDAAGFVIGSATGWLDQENEAPAIRVEHLWRDLLGPLGKPAVFGFPFGHEPDPLSLPLGVQAELDATRRTLRLLKPAVAPA